MPSKPKPLPSRTRSLVRVFAIVVLCVTAALLLSVDWVYEGMERLLMEAEPMIASHPVAGAVVFVLLSALSAILAFFSSALLVPAAVFAWGKVLTVCFLWLGWMLGGLFAFAVGRGLRGHKAGESRLPGRLETYLPGVTRDISFSMILLLQLALPSEIPGYLCGFLGVPLRRYFVAMALAELPYAVGAVLLGETVVNRQIGWLVALGVIGAILGFVLIRALHRRLDPPK